MHYILVVPFFIYLLKFYLYISWLLCFFDSAQNDEYNAMDKPAKNRGFFNQDSDKKLVRENDNDSKVWAISEAGPRRMKSAHERSSFLKKDVANLKVNEQWDKIVQRLNAVFDASVSLIFKDYDIKEEFDFQAILDDMEEHEDESDDSNILRFMSKAFKWNQSEFDKFNRTIKRILMDRQRPRSV